jgi:hypothetical protein
MTLPLQNLDIVKKSLDPGGQEIQSVYILREHNIDSNKLNFDKAMELVFVFVILLGLSETQSLVRTLPNFSKKQQVCDMAVKVLMLSSKN